MLKFDTFNDRQSMSGMRDHDPPDWQSSYRAVQRPLPDPNYFTAGSSSPSQFVVAQRRQSSIPLPGPPPSHPIPSLPSRSQTPYGDQEDLAEDNDMYMQSDSVGYNNYSRPTASPGLAAVAAFSQARLASVSTDSSGFVPRSPSLEEPSRFNGEQPNYQRSTRNALLSAPHSAPRPSSRRALTRALELAREAVRLDATNDDPDGAVQAYGQSVALLKEVMERVMRGDDSTDRRAKDGRRSVVAQEEEVRRLRAIHDTYADRMNILSLIYDIPVMVSGVPVSSSSINPTASASPPLDSIPHPPPEQFDLESARWGSEDAEAIGTAMFTFAESSLTSPSAYEPHHPYAAGTQPNASQQSTSRASITQLPLQQTYPPGSSSRRRALSALPPMAAPPPNVPLPQPPTGAEFLAYPDLNQGTTGTQRNTIGHKRTGSGNRLAALREEGGSMYVPKPPNSTRASPTLDNPMDRGRTAEQFALEGAKTQSRTPSPATPRMPGLPSAPQSADQTSPRHNNAIRPRAGPSLTGQNGSKPLINPSVGMGAISQRRNKTSISPSEGPSPPESPAAAGPSYSVTPVSQNNSHFSHTGRSRSASQPGSRPSLGSQAPEPSMMIGVTAGARKLPHPSTQSSTAPHPAGSSSGLLSPPAAASTLALVSPPTPSLPTIPFSPQPPLPPADPLRKPYHMMTMLRNTIINKSGGYITRRLHVPSEVWSQGGAKLLNLPEKIRVVVVLCSALEDLHLSSNEFCGAGSVNAGITSGIGSIGRKDGEAWNNKLDEFSLICDGLVSDFGKKLGVGEGFAIKKNGLVTNWGSKFARQFDKFTANGKNLDSPASYAQDLSRLFVLAQLLDDHTQAINPSSMAPAYAALPLDIRLSLESKLKRTSEFFASVVLTFVIRDLSQLLDKFAKRCEKWIAD